jgi:glycosyltransferase involved in cell wall biosynthesis
LYLTLLDLSKPEYKGVHNKIIGQVKAFNKLGNLTWYSYFHSGKYRIVTAENEISEEKKAITTNAKISRYFINSMVLNFCKMKSINMIYIRYQSSEPVFLHLLKKLSKMGIEVVLEFPTFPYDREKASYNIIRKIYHQVDKVYRKKLNKHIRFATTLSNDKEIFNIPAINISNGIDLDNIKIVERSIEIEEIILLGVSNLTKWHGYDRIIEGIAQYRSGAGRDNLKFKIVGEGPEKKFLERLVKSYGLEEQVIFTGFKQGKELDMLFDNADIAIEGLGGHRKGIKKSASLKSREYCARGLPFVYSGEVMDIADDLKFAFKVPADESSIDICAIIKFLQNCNKDKNIKYEMRKYAERNFDWTKQMVKVVEAVFVKKGA